VQVEIISAQSEHIPLLLANIREADAKECWDFNCSTPERAITEAVRLSTLCWSGFIDGEMVAMFGVAPIGGDLMKSGRPWLMGTELVDRYPRTFCRNCIPYISTMRDEFKRLSNYVALSNSRAIFWLKWLGFNVYPPEPVGPFLQDFCYFEMRGRG
jgi:hypothetical protein